MSLLVPRVWLRAIWLRGANSINEQVLRVLQPGSRSAREAQGGDTGKRESRGVPAAGKPILCCR